MKNIIVGLACYIIFLICEWSNVNPVEAIILLSILLCIPMSFVLLIKEHEMDRMYYFINPYRFISDSSDLCNVSFRNKSIYLCDNLVLYIRGSLRYLV